MCPEIEAYNLGIGAGSRLVESLKNVSELAFQISEFVIGAVKSGRLEVRDGVIVDPNTES
jgi:hypothetical protein